MLACRWASIPVQHHALKCLSTSLVSQRLSRSASGILPPQIQMAIRSCASASPSRFFFGSNGKPTKDETNPPESTDESLPLSPASNSSQTDSPSSSSSSPSSSSSSESLLSPEQTTTPLSTPAKVDAVVNPQRPTHETPHDFSMCSVI